MNKAKGDMYNWVDYTWNPVKGCEHECIYCYLRSMPYFDMTPRISHKELTAKLPTASWFFVGSSCDMFGAFIPDEWIKAVLCKCADMFSTYVLQTKNPARYQEFLRFFDRNFVLGTTIETDSFKSYSKAPNIRDRSAAMTMLPKHIKRFVTVEPIIDFNIDGLLDLVLACCPDFVNVGADSKHHNMPEPSRDKVNSFVKELRQVTEVRLKKNLRRLL